LFPEQLGFQYSGVLSIRRAARAEWHFNKLESSGHKPRCLCERKEVKEVEEVKEIEELTTAAVEMGLQLAESRVVDEL
jgi:hypothetical protein